MKWLDTFTQVQALEDNCRDVDDDDSNIHATQTQDDGDKPIEDKKERVRSIVQRMNSLRHNQDLPEHYRFRNSIFPG